MMTEEKWIKQMKKYLFNKTYRPFRSLPCFESTNQNVRRRIVYPRPVIEEWGLHESSASFHTINFQIETSKNGFCLEKFRLAGDLEGTEFFMILTVNHEVKVWMLDDDLFRSSDPDRIKVGETLYPLIRRFVEDYSSRRLHLLTDIYEEVGTPEEQKG